MEDVSPGKHLGRLEILSHIHIGSQGEFFRAADTRTGQLVAVQVLPLAGGSELRFQKSHHTAAGLTHPNILAVQRLLSKPGISYLITAPIDGEALRFKLKHAPLPVRSVLDTGIQIAQALAAGHAAGIVHGDLTPDNVVIGPDGQVTLLGFGFPRQYATLPQAVETPRLAIIGAVEYLSPEQLLGKPADARSDIFSLGTLLYEMATGLKAFDGATPLDRMRAVVDAIPVPPPATLPPALTAILERALAKKPEERFQSGEAIGAALEECSAQLAPSAIGSRPRTPLRIRLAAARRKIASARAPRLGWLPLALLAASVVLLALLVARIWRTPVRSAHFQRLTYREGSIVRARFTAGGKEVVYSARFTGFPEASFLITPGEPEGRNLNLPEGSVVTAVSSRNELAVRLRDGYLVRTPLHGGSGDRVTDNVLDADWSPDGESLAVVRYTGGTNTFSVEYPIGTELFQSSYPIEVLRVSPDGKLVAFTVFDGTHRNLLIAGKNGPARTLADTASKSPLRTLCWSPDGKAVWFNPSGSVDSGLLQAVDRNGRKSQVAWSPDLYLDDAGANGRGLQETIRSWSGILSTSPAEHRTQDLSWHGQAVNVLLAAGGQTAVFTEAGAGNTGYSIYARSLDGSAPYRLGAGQLVALSPDGKWATAYRAGQKKFVLLPVGAGEERPISTPGLEDETAPVVGWLADGRRYLVWGRQPGKKAQHFLWDPAGKQLAPVTPEGTPLGYCTGDGLKILAAGAGGRPYVFSSKGGAPMPALGLLAADRPLGWSNTENVIFAAFPGLAVYRIDLKSGVRTAVPTVPHPIEADLLAPRSVTPDGKTLAYTYSYSRAELYLAENWN